MLRKLAHGADEAHAAVVAFGAGEFVLQRARRSPCAEGMASWVFIAQGGRLDREITGYACVGDDGSTHVVERQLNDYESIDWH